ncbi:MAG: putative Ig domain-containing protein [Dehalococcoidales bacterium]
MTDTPLPDGNDAQNDAADAAQSSTPTNPQDNAQLSAQITELNKKIDSLNDKLDKNEASTAQLMKQSQTMVDTTGSAKAQEILRQTVSNPSGFIAIEATNFIVKYIQKNETTRFRASAMAKGRKVLQTIIANYIAQKVPQLNWYGTAVSAQGGNQYHMKTRTNFPVRVNTGLPFIGNVTIAAVAMEVEGDVDTVTNEMKNTKVTMATDEAQRQVFEDIQDEMEYTLKPHKHLWAVMYPTGKGIRAVFRFLKKETAFSIPLLILFVITGFFTPTLFPASTIWRKLGNPVIFRRFLGISPLALWFGIINGIIWGAIIWVIIRFNLIPGLGKSIKFVAAKVFSPLRAFFRNRVRRLATIAGVLVLIVLLILWRVGVFNGPPPLQFSNASPANTAVGSTYTANLTVKGGNKPYTLSLVTNALPPGLSLDTTNNVISGSPTTAGNYQFAMQVQDGSKKDTTVTENYDIVVVPQGNFVVCSTDLPTGSKGKPYSYQIVAQGGYVPYLWGISAGQLMPGMTLSATGVITGTPTARGDFAFTVIADDSSGIATVFSQSYTMHIK